MLEKPAPTNEIQLYRPKCSKCGMLTVLARIEPSGEPGHDLRTFECDACGNTEVVLVKFR
jgi:hypothetical protein